jgi:hypothetical protein
MVSISEIEKISPESREKAYFHVLCDKIPAKKIQGVNYISFSYQGDDELDDDLLDTILSIGIDKNCYIVLDVPYDKEDIDFDNLLMNVNDMSCSVAVLAPQNGDEKAWEQYKNTIKKITKAYFSCNDFSQMVFPITAYIRQMFREVVGEKNENVRLVSGELNEHVYLFVSYYGDKDFSSDEEKEILEIVKSATYEVFGSHQEFEEYAKTITSVLTKAKKSNE